MKRKLLKTLKHFAFSSLVALQRKVETQVCDRMRKRAKAWGSAYNLAIDALCHNDALDVCTVRLGHEILLARGLNLHSPNPNTLKHLKTPNPEPKPSIAHSLLKP